jgi:hypothetical protein
VEIKQQNSGRQPFPSLLKKQKLPKNAVSNNPDLSRIGMQGKDEKVEYYTEKDLKPGATVLVYTRELVILGRLFFVFCFLSSFSLFYSFLFLFFSSLSSSPPPFFHQVVINSLRITM